MDSQGYRVILITNGSVFLSSVLSLHFTGTRRYGLGLGGNNEKK